MTLSQKIAKTRDSVVAIGHQPSPGQFNILGTGFSVGSAEHILSAAHIFQQLSHADRKNLSVMVMVKRENNLEHYAWRQAKVVAENREDDVALIKISDLGESLLSPLELGDSESVSVGDDMYFVGFPYAADLILAGFGITLLVNRATVSNIKHDGVVDTHPRNWIIVDAISNPGNSGCPLIDAVSNKVIGIMSISFRKGSKMDPSLDIKEPMHIAGAKPINLARPLVSQL